MARERDARGALHVRLAILVVALAGLAGLLAPAAGAAADAALVVALAVISRRSPAAAGLLLVPMLRLLWVAMPVRGVEPLHWTALVAVPFLVVTLLMARSGGLSPRALGLARVGVPVVGLAVVGGWAAAGVVVALVAGDAVAWGLSRGSVAWLPVIAYAVLLACTEELAFRGVLPALLNKTLGGHAMAVAVVAAGTLALGAGSPWWIAIAVVIPIASGIIVARTGSLLPVMAGHALFLLALNL